MKQLTRLAYVLIFTLVCGLNCRHKMASDFRATTQPACATQKPVEWHTIEQNSVSIDVRIRELEKLCSTAAMTRTPIVKNKPSSVRLERPGADNTPIFITNDTNNK